MMRSARQREAMRPEMSEPSTSRRNVLTIPLITAAAFALAACGKEGEYYPPNGLPTGDAINQKPSPTTASPSPSPEETLDYREVPQVAGERWNVQWLTLLSVVWAQEIRDQGLRCKGDPHVSDTDDPRYIRKATVIGIPVDEASRGNLGIALTSFDANHPDATEVRYADLSAFNLPEAVPVQHNGKQIWIHPYRVGLAGDADSAAFMAGSSIATTILKQRSGSVENGTHAYAPLIT